VGEKKMEIGFMATGAYGDIRLWGSGFGRVLFWHWNKRAKKRKSEKSVEIAVDFSVYGWMACMV
jgi:hypothetical protein